MSQPTIIYIHGFRSGANGSKREELQKHFGDRYRVIAPEVDADPEKSLVVINVTILRERPEIIIGTFTSKPSNPSSTPTTSPS